MKKELIKEFNSAAFCASFEVVTIGKFYTYLVSEYRRVAPKDWSSNFQVSTFSDSYVAERCFDDIVRAWL